MRVCGSRSLAGAGTMVQPLMAGLVAVVAQPVESQVGGDAKKPGAEFSGGLVVSRAVYAKEHFLGEFLGDGDIADQAVNVADHGAAIFLDDTAETRPVARLEGQHPRDILLPCKAWCHRKDIPDRQRAH
jgi:hypothetical protein